MRWRRAPRSRPEPLRGPRALCWQHEGRESSCSIAIFALAAAVWTPPERRTRRAVTHPPHPARDFFVIGLGASLRENLVLPPTGSTDSRRRGPCRIHPDSIQGSTSPPERCAAVAYGGRAGHVNRSARRIRGTRNLGRSAPCAFPRGWGRRAYVERRGVTAPRRRFSHGVCRIGALPSAIRRGEP